MAIFLSNGYNQSVKYLWLTAIVLLAAVLRFTSLSSLPAGFSADEASFGYNAYSLLHTGRDEWGMPWFTLLTHNQLSFGDYRFPLYTFLAVPSVAIFGLTEFATRLPNAILGTLSVITLYGLAYRLTKRSSMALTSALLVAVLPWTIQLSRGAFEPNALVFFIPLGLSLLLGDSMIFGGTVFGVGSYAYLAVRWLEPLLIICLLPFFRRRLIPFLLMFIVVAGPGLLSVFYNGNHRAVDVAIWNPDDHWRSVATSQFQAQGSGIPRPISRLWFNKATSLVWDFSHRYFNYLSPVFWFSTGAGESAYGFVPDRGLLYLLLAPCLLIGFIWLIRHPDRTSYLIWLLVILSVIPAAVTKGQVAANRSVLLVIPLILISAIGFSRLSGYFSGYQSRRLIYIAGIGILSLSLASFVITYSVVQPRVSGRSMSYGWKEVTTRTQGLLDQYSEIYVSRSFSEAHIFIAFYSRFDPRQYQSASVNWRRFQSEGFLFLDQLDGYNLGKYRFGSIHPEIATTTNRLYIGRPDDFPAGYPGYFSLDDLSGQPVFLVAPAK